MTIMQVAKKAGVSCMTISRVISGNGTVSPATRERILRVMRETGYVPSLAARAMRSGDKLRANSQLCCALIFGADTQYARDFFYEIAYAAEQEAAANGLCLLQSHWQDTFDESWLRMQSLFSIGGLCGTILAGQFSREELSAIKKNNKNLVVIDGPVPSDLPVASLESDNSGGCKMALEHLIERGAKRILILTGPAKDHYFSQAMIQAVEKVRPTCKEIKIIHSHLTSENGREIVKRIFAEGKRYDGIFANDDVAMGALRGLYELGLKIPDEVKVVGFDDTIHGQYTIPSLTTIQINKSQLGRESVRTLVGMFRGQEELLNIKKIVKAKLIVREST